MNEQNVEQNFIKQWNEICKSEEEISMRKRKIINEMNIEESKVKEEMAIKKQKMLDEFMKEIVKKDEENTKLRKENRELKLKMAKIESDLKAQNLSIPHRKLSAELVNELFASLPPKNAFVLLSKMPNGLLAKNLQKMIIVIKNNKLAEKTIKRERRRQQIQLGNNFCLVCEDRASGHNYGAQSCEGCKGFFRRYVLANLHFHCNRNGNCTIDRNTRNRCQKCRFDKCIQVGMQPNRIPSYQYVRNQNRNQNEDFDDDISDE